MFMKVAGHSFCDSHSPPPPAPPSKIEPPPFLEAPPIEKYKNNFSCQYDFFIDKVSPLQSTAFHRTNNSTRDTFLKVLTKERMF